MGSLVVVGVASCLVCFCNSLVHCFLSSVKLRYAIAYSRKKYIFTGFYLFVKHVYNFSAIVLVSYETSHVYFNYYIHYFFPKNIQ